MTEPRVTIFEAGRRDLDEVMIVMTEAFDPDFGEAWSRAQCSGILDQPGVWLSIVRIGDEPAGFALARKIVDEAELLLLGVRPQFRRRGLGARLLQRVCLAAASIGAVRLHLEVRDGNGATHLYDRHGFRQIGRRRNYYRGCSGRKFDAITLALPLKNTAI